MSDKKQVSTATSLPENFTNLEDFWEFWDNHSSADYEDVMEPVNIDIALSAEKLYCAIAKDLWVNGN